MWGGPGRDAPAIGLSDHSIERNRRPVHGRNLVPQLYCPNPALGAPTSPDDGQQVDEK